MLLLPSASFQHKVNNFTNIINISAQFYTDLNYVNYASSWPEWVYCNIVLLLPVLCHTTCTLLPLETISKLCNSLESFNCFKTLRRSCITLYNITLPCSWSQMEILIQHNFRFEGSLVPSHCDKITSSLMGGSKLNTENNVQ